MKRALLIGINKYDCVSDLTGCVADATAMRDMLNRNEDGTPNYDCRLMVYGDSQSGGKITIARLRAALHELFDYTGDVFLFFSGHGVLTGTGGYVVTCDAERDSWGIPMQEIVHLASDSRARNVVIIMDCCHSGAAADLSFTITSSRNNPQALLRENMTVIAASRDTQSTSEANGHGIFTTAVLDALDGGAADLTGRVTATSIYTYVERRFGEWMQRTVYKAYVTEVAVIRQCTPLINRSDLRALVNYFPTPQYKYPLSPEYNSEDKQARARKRVNHEKVNIGRLFKQYRDLGLLTATIKGEHFSLAARNSHTVELTKRGREYWHLVTNDRV